ncbi:RES domain-containing protein [Rhodococcus rhodochrous]|uniref:RES domain-containing protein n=1 Tax=Rhodococcus rhodochrous TaxID=1829 RepID=UPI000AC6B195
MGCPGPRTGPRCPPAPPSGAHSTHRAAHVPNPTPQPDQFAGGRFDSLDGSYAYLHLADSPDGAIAETLCRDLPLEPGTARIVPTAAMRGRTLTALTLRPHPDRRRPARTTPVGHRARPPAHHIRGPALASPPAAGPRTVHRGGPISDGY